jgi:hypothetical protein
MGDMSLQHLLLVLLCLLSLWGKMEWGQFAMQDQLHRLVAMLVMLMPAIVVAAGLCLMMQIMGMLP